MFCAYPRPRYQVSVYRTIGPLVLWNIDANQTKLLRFCLPLNMENVSTDKLRILNQCNTITENSPRGLGNFLKIIFNIIFELFSNYLQKMFYLL